MTGSVLDNLNDEQLEAVTTTEGYVRVIAGAGSGKTRALTHRFAYLVNEIGIPPGNILCVTFTNKAANEMRARIHNLTGDRDTGYINTFHGFCANVLQEESHVFHYPKSFLVLDNADIDSMLSMIYEERGLTLRDMTFGAARDMIEMIKLKERPNYYEDLTKMSLTELQEKYLQATTAKEIIFYGYLYQEKKCFGLDYNDLLVLTLYVFRESEESRERWTKRLMYIMVDEFQDIDEPQYRLMKVLSSYHKNLFVVGDPDQTIYTWRGANIEYLLNFHIEFPGTHTVEMNLNYRSTAEILNCANDLIDKNVNRIKKDLLPMLGHGDAAKVYFAKNTEDEAEYIVSEMLRLHEAGVPFRDMTVLYRSHFLSRSIEQVLMAKKVPYTLYSGVQFYDRAEIKVALSYLRILVSEDDLSFRRVVNMPRRNLGNRRLKFLEEYVEKEYAERADSRRGVDYDAEGADVIDHPISLLRALRETIDDPIFKGTKAKAFLTLIDELKAMVDKKSISELLAEVLHRSGFEERLRTEGSQERLDNLAELRQSIYDYETTCGEETNLDSYMKHIALYTNSDLTDTRDRVRMMTVHAAKGLEFPTVFLCGMNEGVFPSKKTRTELAMEEERRLCFVAVTRAEKRLYLTEAAGRSFDGAPRYPSRFILDVNRKFLEFAKEPEPSLIEETRAYLNVVNKSFIVEKEEKLFPIGTKVKHMVFGTGEILDQDMEMQAYSVKFEGQATERFIAFKVRLEEVSE